jgi:hypothetical protein
MNKYVIVEVAGDYNHAGSKATADIAVIAKQNGFQPLNLRMCSTLNTKIAKVQRQIGYEKDWKKIVNTIEDGSLVLLQHPFHYPQLTREKSLRILKYKKHVKIISVIHDVEKLRAFRYNEYYKNEFSFMLSIADMYIVHNHIMKDYFIECGIPEEHIVVLDIFDYVMRGPLKEKALFADSLSIAGNLDTTKCGYIGQLGQLKDIRICLYGSNYNEDLNSYSNINYFGSFPPEDIPNQLKSGFGLVWDGNSIEGCLGESGQYLKYNNPHKLSLYLASGLPVVIWKDAAEAEFVKEHHVGVCVDSLYEAQKVISKISKKEYEEMAKSVWLLAADLRTGHYFAQALKEACFGIGK